MVNSQSNNRYLLSAVGEERAGLFRCLGWAGWLSLGTLVLTGSAGLAGEQKVLQELRKEGEQRVASLPPRDAEDTQSLPRWFRAYLRQKLKGLPESGQPQYPRGAAELLIWLEAQGSVSCQELERRVRSIQDAVVSTVRENELRRRYPSEWEVAVPAGTRLDRLRGLLDAQFARLPARDLEDETPLPIWFRVHLRRQMPDLPTSGPYQYPRTASRMLQQLLSAPDAPELERLLESEREKEEVRTCAVSPSPPPS